MRPTQRTYYNKLTGELFRMYHSDTTGKNMLINIDTGYSISSGYLIAGHNDITYKLNTGKVIDLKRGEFYPLQISTGEVPTYKKFTGIQKRFTKIK